MELKSVALIPARSGSKRIKNKNVRILNGHPLLGYSVRAAIDSGIFDDVVCATDDEQYAEIARKYGATVPKLRPKSISGDSSPDIDWVKWILSELSGLKLSYDIFSILRPTSPFRSEKTIRKAFETFVGDSKADSLRAVEKCKQHPGKMWVLRNGRMLPIMPFERKDTPWHSSQTASLPEFYIQNASLEFSWCINVTERNSIAGETIVPFISQGMEGFDINDPEDWILAEHYIENRQVTLPAIKFEAAN